jgi:hypothetical protein
MPAVTFFPWLAPEGIANNGDGSFLEEAITVDGVPCCRVTTGAEQYIELDTYDGEHTDLDLDTCCFSFRFRFAQIVTGDTNGDSVFMAVNASGDPIWAAFLGSDSRLRFTRADLNLIAGAVIDPLSANTWYEVRTKSTRSTGALDVWVYTNTGVLVDSFTVSANLGSGTHAKLRFGQCSDFNASDFGNVHIGPVFIDDDEPPDSLSQRVGIKLPAADSDVAGWPPSDGDLLNEMLANNPVDPDTYVSSSVVGAAFRVSFVSNAAAGLNIETVVCIRTLGRAAAISAEAAMAATLIGSVTPVESATFNAPVAGSAITGFGVVLPNDPDTDAPWEPEILDIVEAGATKKTDTNEARVYDLYLLVWYTAAAAADGVRMGNPNHPSTRAMLRLMGVAV